MSAVGANRAETLKHTLDHLAHYLPAQGPIGVFIHHNTLHAFQHLTFEEAVAKAGTMYGAQPYMTEERFRRELEDGRIRHDDIRFVLSGEPNADIIPGLDRRGLREQALIAGLREPDSTTIHWEMEEGELGEAIGEDLALFARCLTLTPAAEGTSEIPARPRDGVWRTERVDLDEIVDPLLIRLCAVYTDQGVSYWPMPGREQGFYASCRALLMQPQAVYPEHLEKLGDEFRLQFRAEWTATDALLDALDDLGVPEESWEHYLQAELLALPGWPGLFRRLEEEPHLAPHEDLPCKLVDYLAVRLTFLVVALRSVTGSVREWRRPTPVDVDAEASQLAAAAHLFQLCRRVGITAEKIDGATAEQKQRLTEEVAAFDELERRRVFQLAYERRHEHLILDPLASFRRVSPPRDFGSRPEAQVFFCLDEREESIRRHLEEVAPKVETFSAAGFYGVAVDYKGIDDAHSAPFCPVVVKPQHAVLEKPLEQDRTLHEQRQARRKLWAQLAANRFVSSRTILRGWFSTAVLGLFSVFPLAARVLAPRVYTKVREKLNESFLPEPRTEMTLTRHGQHSHDVAEGLLVGFEKQEKADRVQSVLGPAGLHTKFSRIVAILGHGSTSLNNPHESAHDCGACGGRRGGPNARLFAAMANRPEVRQILRERGIAIPDDTWFVGGYHDTCSDDVDFFDTDAIPATHGDDFARLTKALDGARALNAHERSRRFEAARCGDSADKALRHVEERSEHLAEPRPEYGHCTNSSCIVGRRSLTRGLFMDRRAFLVSYDPTLDPDDDALGRLLGAAVPVCAGISLEYYFSFVDNERYGCGTKLPHNVTGLVGVMNGHASDLRTGLPWQMVEIHEPVRILFAIETTPARLKKVIARSALITQFVANRWVRVATVDPETGAMHMYRDGEFVPYQPEPINLPVAPNSMDWYRGKLEHLPIARIKSRKEPVSAR